MAAIAEALPAFRPVPHRLELIASVRGVAYYNDSKATNVAAAVRACKSFASGLWAIVGGRDKGSDFRPLAAVLQGRAKAALLIGEATPLIRQALDGCVATVEAGTLEKAVEIAAGRAERGETVLLAPACASFDQFEDYLARGEAFRQLVRELEG